jgi:hypothetical protein
MYESVSSVFAADHDALSWETYAACCRQPGDLKRQVRSEAVRQSTSCVQDEGSAWDWDPHKGNGIAEM